MKIQISNWTLTIYTAVEIDLNWIENVVQRLNYSFDQYKQFAYIFQLTPFKTCIPPICWIDEINTCKNLI
jgi:hypothetical protein